MNRGELRAQVLRAHQQYIPAIKKSGLICPGCGQYIMGGWDPHEWLVRRSAVSVPKQYLIFVPENVIPVHHECHNNSKELTRKCLAHLVPVIFSAIKIGQWYERLWRFNGLSVPKGKLIPPKDLPLSMRLRMFNEGCETLGVQPDGWETEDGIDVRGAAIARWAGKTRRSTPKVPYTWQGISSARLYEAMATGYWMDYLKGVIG